MYGTKNGHYLGRKTLHYSVPACLSATLLSVLIQKNHPSQITKSTVPTEGLPSPSHGTYTCLTILNTGKGHTRQLGCSWALYIRHLTWNTTGRVYIYLGLARICLWMSRSCLNMFYICLGIKQKKHVSNWNLLKQKLQQWQRNPPIQGSHQRVTTKSLIT